MSSLLSKMISDVFSNGVFPLPTIPSVPWRNVKGSRATYFGAPRTEINPKTGKPYPPHGACDLIAPANTPVLAVARGTVWFSGRFYTSKRTDRDPKSPHFGEVICERELFQLVVVHDHFIARYGEVALTLPPGIAKDKDVEAGQVIAFVGLNCASEQMLHFEMFGDVARRDALTVDPSPTKYKFVPWRDYQRRDDLLDPTPYLDRWAMEMMQRQAEAERLAREAMAQFRRWGSGAPKRLPGVRLPGWR
jgi:murein DD-endopeptidase MepM/ murein hydrolase activator NlpD